MRIVIFLQGTALMHSSGVGKTPRERIKQVKEGEASVGEYKSYVPVGKANEKTKKWHNQGAEILYLSSRRGETSKKEDREILNRYNFPPGDVFCRGFFESYAKIVERMMPDILIEDDCESIGGEFQMTYPHIKPEKKKLIRSVVVKEFSGIDNLPDDISKLFES
jgi:hypothetical protein